MENIRAKRIHANLKYALSCMVLAVIVFFAAATVKFGETSILVQLEYVLIIVLGFVDLWIVYFHELFSRRENAKKGYEYFDKHEGLYSSFFSSTVFLCVLMLCSLILCCFGPKSATDASLGFVVGFSLIAQAFSAVIDELFGKSKQDSDGNSEKRSSIFVHALSLSVGFALSFALSYLCIALLYKANGGISLHLQAFGGARLIAMLVAAPFGDMLASMSRNTEARLIYFRLTRSPGYAKLCCKLFGGCPAPFLRMSGCLSACVVTHALTELVVSCI